MNKSRLLVILFLLIFFPGHSALAQDESATLTLRITRVIGIGGIGDNIQGTFSMRVSGPQDLTSVEFYIDEQMIGVDEQVPFALQFSTTGFTPGKHNLHAVGNTNDGRVLSSNVITRDFLDPDSIVSEVFLPIIGILTLILALSTAGQMLRAKFGKSRPVGDYGSLGGVVCPRCQLPYARTFLALRLGIGTLERCPHCRKWAIVRRASPSALEAAEARLVQDAQAGALNTDESEGDRRRRMVEDSRFED
ncbi:MAG: Ig-like domain-containing protein [Anaerolineae bacterium]|nr:Ig-like domain-containing protein [Anaerolineae bacterium]